MRLGVVKLGGAAITKKDRPFELRLRILESICKSLADALRSSCIDRLVVVHGGGSFGHYVVSEHGGLSTKDAYAQTVFFMRELNQIVVEMLNLAGLNAVGLDTHAIAYADKGRIAIDTMVIARFVEAGLVPVMYGDAILDVDGDSLVLSGDDIAWEVAYVLGAHRLVFVTSVPGVIVGGRVAKMLSLSRDLESIDRLDVAGRDVTGGMRAKLAKGLGKVSRIGAVYIVGPKPQVVYESLCFEPSVGTRVVE